jgi:hypothetical protein
MVHAWLVTDAQVWLWIRPPGLLGDRPAPLVLPESTPPASLRLANGTAHLDKVAPPYRHTFTHRTWHVVAAVYHWKNLDVPRHGKKAGIGWSAADLANAGLPRAFARGWEALRG